mgnify:CR=1 FL=1
MYNVTEKYSELIKAPVRYTGISGAVRLKDGTMIPLTDSNIDGGSADSPGSPATLTGR